MEDSTSSTLQEIEKLKHKISSYRDTLMTLKMGTSLEDYLIMKNETEALKKQISFIEGLTQTLDEKQQTQNEVYEEQIQLFSLQLEELKQTVKDMNQEILSILNKISINNKVENESEKESSSIQEKKDRNKSNDKLTPINEMQHNDKQSSTISNQPSYKQLRSLTNQVLHPQKIHESIASFEETGFIGDQKDQRYFNQHYFQSINSHPNYNDLNNNIGKTPLRFIKTDEIQDNKIKDSGNSIVSTSIGRVPENENTTILTPIDKSDEDEVMVEKEILNFNTQPESLEEGKKQKNSVFFNLFRK